MTEPRALDEYDPNNPFTAIALLGERIRRLSEQEKEMTEREDKLEARIAKIEGSLGRGAGILIGLAAVGSLSGAIMAYGKVIFAPWYNSK